MSTENNHRQGIDGLVPVADVVAVEIRGGEAAVVRAGELPTSPTLADVAAGLTCGKGNLLSRAALRRVCIRSRAGSAQTRGNGPVI